MLPSLPMTIRVGGWVEKQVLFAPEHFGPQMVAPLLPESRRVAADRKESGR
jgi:hypothetical protein